MLLLKSLLPLALGVGLANAASITITYWRTKDCQGDGTTLTVNGDSCHTGDLDVESFEVTDQDGACVLYSSLNFYADGSACIGSVNNQYGTPCLGQGPGSDGGPYPAGCQNINGGAGSVGYFIGIG